MNSDVVSDSPQELSCGDHVCFIFDSDKEQIEFLAEFIKAGLEKNEKIIYISASEDYSSIINQLKTQDLDLESLLSASKFEIYNTKETYLKDDQFSPEDMCGFIKEQTDRAIDEGFRALRITGEMTWTLHEPDVADKLMEYEVMINSGLCNNNCVALCQYDKRLFDSSKLLELISAHPKSVVGNNIYSNFEPGEQTLFMANKAATNDTSESTMDVSHNGAKETLRHGEESYKWLYEHNPSMYFTLDTDGIVVSVNKFGAEQLGYESNELIGKSVFDIFHPKDRKLVKEKVVSFLNNPDGVANWEFRKVRKDGRTIWVHERVRLLEDDKGRKLLLVVCDDISKQKRDERLLSSEKRALELIASNLHIHEILKGICLEVEAQSDSMLCSFLLLDKETETLHTGAAPSLPPEYTQAIEGLHIGPAVGSCGTAAYRNEPVIVSDIATDPLWKNGKTLALKHNLKACWSTPINAIDGSVLGTFAVYYKEPRRPEEEELTIIERATYLAKIAIERSQFDKELEANLSLITKKKRYEETVRIVTQSVHRSIELQEVIENAVDSMHKNISEIKYVAIYLVEGRHAVAKSYRGFPDWFIERAGRILYPIGYTWKTIIEGKPRYCPDVDEDNVIGPAGRELGTKSYASMPIQFGGKTIGAIIINSLKKHAFDQDDLKLLEIVSNQISVAVNNAKQAEELKLARDELDLRVNQRTADLLRINTLLEHEIHDRKVAEEQIKKSLDEKDVLLKEIHHRVKNNLQLISSLISLQSEYFQDEKAVEMIEESQNRIRTLAMIHEQLYQSPDLARIDIGLYIQELTANLFNSYQVDPSQINADVDVSGVLLDINKAIPCGLIINELVSNSLKHAFPNGRQGKVMVRLFTNNSTEDSSDVPYDLVIRDDGIGFPEEIDYKHTDSLGLQLVNTLTKQLKGNIELDTSNGTEFRITFSS